ncbi:thioredoxin domain-containing protein, partial [Microbacterium arthrosphaerae]
MLAAREDPRHGGFGDPAAPAPKFPVATALRFLQTRLVRERAAEAAAVADRALAAMAASPLRDTVEGGFFRYATRPDWTVPHFERMLTDNAQLLDVALDASPSREDVARGIAGFLVEVLQQPGGGFGAAQDSESWIDGARSEGGYYERDAAARATLDPPAVDGKVVTGWNGLAIGALARAGGRLGEASWIASARWAADAVLETNLDADGRLVRASLDEVPSRAHATLADHGQLAAGLLALAAATGETAYA